eukprot:431414_1
MAYNNNIFNWLVAVCIILMIVILVYACLSLIASAASYKNQKQRKHKINKLLIVLSIITISSFTLCSIFGFAFTIIVLFTNNLNAQATPYAFITYIFGMLFYLLSPMFMIFVFTVRLDVTFRHSPLEYSKRTVRSLYISSITLLFIFICCISFGSTHYGQAAHIGYIFAGIWIILQISLSIILCVLFYRKIQILTITKKLANKNEISVASKTGTLTYTTNQSDKLNKSENVDNEFSFIVIKHGILVPISIVSSFICFTLAVIISMSQSPYSFQAIGIFLTVSDCTISSLSIYLLFPFNDGLYKWLCNPLHSLCEKYKVSQINKKLKDEQNGKNHQDKEIDIQTIEIDSNVEKVNAVNEKQEQDEQEHQQAQKQSSKISEKDDHFVLRDDGIKFDLKNKNPSKMVAILH